MQEKYGDTNKYEYLTDPGNFVQYGATRFFVCFVALISQLFWGFQDWTDLVVRVKIYLPPNDE